MNNLPVEIVNKYFKIKELCLKTEEIDPDRFGNLLTLVHLRDCLDHSMRFFAANYDGDEQKKSDELRKLDLHLITMHIDLQTQAMTHYYVTILDNVSVYDSKLLCEYFSNYLEYRQELECIPSIIKENYKFLESYDVPSNDCNYKDKYEQCCNRDSKTSKYLEKIEYIHAYFFNEDNIEALKNMSKHKAKNVRKKDTFWKICYLSICFICIILIIVILLH